MRDTPSPCREPILRRKAVLVKSPNRADPHSATVVFVSRDTRLLYAFDAGYILRRFPSPIESFTLISPPLAVGSSSMDSSVVDTSSLSLPVDRENGVAPASDDNPSPQAATSPGAGGRVKLMVSYGGRIQPRPHDSARLSYVGGETKILSLDRSARLPALLAKLATLVPCAPFCLKYQLPGEDLDALVSVTDEDDLEHMMVEYDRLHGSSSSPKPTHRLRLFLFTLRPPPPPPSAALLDAARPDRQWFFDALNAVSAPAPPATQPSVVAASPSPDYLFGLDEGFVPPPAVKVAVDPQPPLTLETLSIEAPAKTDLAKVEPHQQIPEAADSTVTAPVVVSMAEVQGPIQELHSLQVAENPPPLIPQNSSEEAVRRDHATEYQVPRDAEKVAPAAAQAPEQRSGLPVARYASLAPGHDQAVYLLPTSQGVYPGFYAAAPWIATAEAYRSAAVSAKAMGGGGGAEAYAAGGGQLAYDSTGRVVYYASMVPTYQTVSSVAAYNPVGAAVKAAKPSQIS
ncbi:uncharacterized protein LOC135636061 [Musa acuminata AAA Group]|uniref:uncharacterized protein LOC135636061 n=1 Tax=Musa acuminata AAA Group TaxID=214697 RepID=UPI0031DE3669